MILYCVDWAQQQQGTGTSPVPEFSAWVNVAAIEINLRSKTRVFFVLFYAYHYSLSYQPQTGVGSFKQGKHDLHAKGCLQRGRTIAIDKQASGADVTCEPSIVQADSVCVGPLEEDDRAHWIPNHPSLFHARSERIFQKFIQQNPARLSPFGLALSRPPESTVPQQATKLLIRFPLITRPLRGSEAALLRFRTTRRI